MLITTVAIHRRFRAYHSPDGRGGKKNDVSEQGRSSSLVDEVKSGKTHSYTTSHQIKTQLGGSTNSSRGTRISSFDVTGVNAS